MAEKPKLKSAPADPTVIQKYVVDESGNRYIPGSRRPDGSLRKPILVKEGYVPQEEHTRYLTAPQRFRKDREEKLRVPIGSELAEDEIKGKGKGSSAKRKAKKKVENGE